jgi:hypothetical protein
MKQMVRNAFVPFQAPVSMIKVHHYCNDNESFHNCMILRIVLNTHPDNTLKRPRCSNEVRRRLCKIVTNALRGCPGCQILRMIS